MLKKLHDHEDELAMPTVSKYFETYIKLSQDRAIFLSEDFTKEVSSQMAALLLHYDNEDQNDDITIYINSHGGDVSALTCIYDVIQMIKAPVKTVCIGKCYSAGAVLLCAGAKGKRYILPHAEVMIHRVQCMFPMMDKMQIDNESYIKFLDSVNNNVMKIISKHTGQKIEKVKADFNSTRHMFLDAKEAVAYGLVDHIL